MKKITPILCLALATCFSPASPGTEHNGKQGSHPSSISLLREGFQTPPDSIKPGVYWYWLNDNISREGVIRDLEAMASVGIGRAYIGNIGLDKTPYGKVKLFSDEWWDILHAALRTAARLGIEIGIFNSPGWSQSGGPWVKPDAAMRRLATTELHIQGPKRINLKLPAPQGNSQDVAVLAFPDPAIERAKVTNSDAKIWSTPEIREIRNLIDGDLGTETIFPWLVGSNKSLDITISVDKPFTARSLTLHPIPKPFKVDCELQALKDSSFVSVKSFSVDRSISWPSLGFLPYGPVCISFPAVTSDTFRIVFRNIQRNPFMGLDSTVCGFAEIELTSAPRLERYVEKQLGKMVQDVDPTWDAYKWPRQPDATNEEFCVGRSAVIDIAQNLSADGVLDWNAPAGPWTILRVGMLPTGVTNAPATPEGRGLEVDKMSRKDVRAHFEAFMKKILDRIPAEDRKTLRFTIADSYETGSENWTDGFDKAFRSRYGYDPLPWLSVLTGRVVGTADQSDRFLWDVRRLVADLIAYNYVGGLREASNEHGLKLWLENYGTWGFPSEFLKYGGQADELSGEFWADGLYGIGPIELRAASSAAHIYGKNRVWAESWTSGDRPFGRYPALLKKLGDWSFTQGVNSTLLHVNISQPYEDRQPGMNAEFGTEFNRFNTWFVKSQPFIQYLRRCNFMLQQGKPVVDVAYFIGEDAPVMTGPIDLPLPKGYSSDYINAEVIESRLSVKDGKLVLPDGISYSLMVLPPLETMRPGLLRRIRDLVEDGAVILGPKPLRSPSLQDFPAADAEVRNLANALWGDVDGASVKFRIFGNGMVMMGMDLKSALAMVHTVPDFEVSSADSVLYVHRRLDDVDVYFVSNQTEKTVSIHPTFRVTRSQPEFWDPVTGETRPLPLFSQGENSTSVPLKFVRHQSGFIVFEMSQARVSSNPAASNSPEPREILKIDEPWEVTFDPAMRGPEKPITFNRLEDWSIRPGSAIRYYSGTAVYRTAFRLDSIPHAGNIMLDLGEVRCIGRVRMNGIVVGGVWTDPWWVEIGRYLKVGRNELEVEVTNTWVNRLIGDSRLPETERKTWTLVNPYKPESLLEPSGLLGPVRLIVIQ